MILTIDAGDGAADTAEVIVLFDHEEVGSASERGAAGGFLGSVLERVAAACGLDRPVTSPATRSPSTAAW